MNLVAGWARFFARIILKNIPGRAKAIVIEDEFVAGYHRKHGRNPIGNKDRKNKSKKNK